MRPEIAKYLWDVREACRLLESFVRGRSLDDYRGDPMLRSAVERQFEIIGEAINQACKTDPSVGQRISDSRQIVAFRNQLIHGYRFIEHAEVWQILQDDLPRLNIEITTLLQELDG